jgi:hypothetical protein
MFTFWPYMITFLTYCYYCFPEIIMQINTFFQDGYPIRPKSMNNINMKPAFLTIFNFFMSFMKEKLRRRVSQQYNMTIFWNITQCLFLTFVDVS